MKITVENTDIEGVKIITPKVFSDERGYFMETYQAEDFKEAGIDVEFVQDNQSSSTKGVLRGLHYQIEHPQDKLVRVVRGEVFDVAVDLRKGSATYGEWFGVLLSEENKKQFFIPKGFAHGFVFGFVFDELAVVDEAVLAEEVAFFFGGFFEEGRVLGCADGHLAVDDGAVAFLGESPGERGSFVDESP